MNCGSRSYFTTLLTTVLIAFHHYLLAGLISLSSYFISTHLMLCVQQAGEIDKLSVFVGAKYLSLIVCRSTSIVVNSTVDTLLSLLQFLLDLTTSVL